jgi:uncharacterized protein
VNPTRALESITKFLVRTYDPDAVILFGSAADGRAGPNSDIDLVVVGRFHEPRAIRGREVSPLFDEYAVPLDVQFYTAEEFEREARESSSFTAMVDRHGTRLYTRV